MLRKIPTILLFSLFAFCPAFAQEERVLSSSDFLIPVAPGGVPVAFSISGEGKRFSPIWGLDQAWINEQNLRKGINHMGKENIGIGRSAFRVTKALVNDSELATDPINHLRQRNTIFNIVSDTLPLVLTCDQEAGVDSYYRTGNTANVERWSAMLNAHVKWLKENSKHRVAGVSPFNEPDYWTSEGATINNSRDIAKKIRDDYPQLSDVAIVGANTLNDDKAVSWYNAGKEYYDWGNTHQLAGSMDNYKAFYQLLAKDGKIGYNDEMHNVAEAFIGLEYGMTVGIWWGFDSRARGEFCDISRHGARLGYAEHPNNWTAATVYRHDDGRVKAFLGSSERQAYTTQYRLISTDHEVYYDGVGPTREILQTIHGGTGYQKGQKNAEKVIDVTWGADVQPSTIDGTYKIMNKLTQMVVAEHGELNGHPNIAQVNYNGNAKQHWEVYPAGNSVDGDYSFYIIKSVNDGKFMDVLNFSTQSGANVISFGSGTPSSNEQWYLEYVGNGYYYIRNRETALYLTLANSNKLQGVNINQQTKLDNPDRQLWRFLPIDASCETIPPETPTGLTLTPQSASILLEWEANQEADIDGYMILRAEQGKENWNTIARKLKTTKFVDNSCRQGIDYIYAVKAIDFSENMSEPCEAKAASTTGVSTMTTRLTMDNHLLDATSNQMDAVAYGNPPYVISNLAAEGTHALNLNGTNQFVQLPYEITSTPERTFMAWVYWRNTSTAGQRLFDFGNGPDQSLYLTPSDGNSLALVYKNGENTENLRGASKLVSLRWKHVAVTIGKDSTVVYVDGEKVAHSTSLTSDNLNFHSSLNFLGRGQDSSIPLLKAYIDDVRFYNYSLEAEEVKTAMLSATDKIETIETMDNTSIDEFFTIGGVKVGQPHDKGIYIQKSKGKRAQKVIVQ